jgi:hypothetical protein
MFYMKTPQLSIPVRHKAYWSENDRIVEYINQYANQREPLDERSALAAASVLGRVAATPRTFPSGPGGGQPVIQDAVEYNHRANLRAVPTYPGPARRPIEEKHQALWTLLFSPQFRTGGATVAELTEAAEVAGHQYQSLAWIRDVCKKWRTAGYVVFEQEGHDFRYWRDDDSIDAQLRKEA